MGKSIVIGFGEVGSAVWNVCEDSDRYDPEKGFFGEVKTYDILLVCIPYSEEFVNIVKEYQKKFNIKSTIIFSSVPIGTSRLVNAVHSPVEGKHPYLITGMERFQRWVGGIDELAIEYLTSWFGRLKIVYTPEETEFLKLRSTTLYGMTIEYARYTNEVCKEHNFNYDNVLDYDMNYNDLYEHTPYSRSLITPPDGPIGGHCVVPNAKILNGQHPFPNVLERLLEDD